MGTIFSVTEARRLTPPRKMMAQIATRTTPTIQEGIPKAVLKVEPMELDCTMQPKKPRARVMAMAKKPARKRAKAAGKCGANIVDRAALYRAVGALPAGHDGQCGLCINGGHAEEGDNPHPEDGTGAAGEDGAGSTYDVTGAHLRRNGGGKGLKGCHGVGLLFAPQGQVAEYPAHTLAKVANLHESGFNGIPEAYRNQQDKQNVV